MSYSVTYKDYQYRVGEWGALVIYYYYFFLVNGVPLLLTFLSLLKIYNMLAEHFSYFLYHFIFSFNICALNVYSLPTTFSLATVDKAARPKLWVDL